MHAPPPCQDHCGGNSIALFVESQRGRSLSSSLGAEDGTKEKQKNKKKGIEGKGKRKEPAVPTARRAVLRRWRELLRSIPSSRMPSKSRIALGS